MRDKNDENLDVISSIGTKTVKKDQNRQEISARVFTNQIKLITEAK